MADAYFRRIDCRKLRSEAFYQRSDVLSRKNPIKQTAWGRFFQMLITWTVYILFRPKVTFADKSLKKRLRHCPAVYVCNHTHHFDGAFVGAVLHGYKPYVLVKSTWYEKKAVGRMISWCRCIPINLDEADGEWFSLSEQVIAQGGSMAIFPEGAIARDGRMEEFRPGAALLCAKHGIPIVPCAIYGTYRPIFGMRQRLLVGSPIESDCPKDMRHSKYARILCAKAQEEVAALYDTLEERFGDCGTYPKRDKQIQS